LLHRNRAESSLPPFDIALSKTKISLKFPAHWLAQAPLTQADLNQEAEYLKAAGYKLEFC
jgi:exopolyphosphatase/guanosine-5'-triphosphate,3'-diphosphate pyrophosphatase